jgi:hypothetical protein
MAGAGTTIRSAQPWRRQTDDSGLDLNCRARLCVIGRKTGRIWVAPADDESAGPWPMIGESRMTAEPAPDVGSAPWRRRGM